MSNLAEKFTFIKTSLGGNREKSGFEYTFGMPEEEVHRITPPSRANRRVIAELEYALHLSEANDNAYASQLEQALDLLTADAAQEFKLFLRLYPLGQGLDTDFLRHINGRGKDCL